MTYLAIGIVITVLVLFTLYMLVVTASMGSEYFKVPQFMLSSLKYSEEADVKLNLLMDKYDAGILLCRRQKNELIFTEKETGKHAGTIWIGNKYYSYANLYSYGIEARNTWACNKPKIKTFKRVVKLEKQLDISSGNQASDNAPKAESKRQSNEEVILD